MTRFAVDWEAIEREYRAGQLSIREIARQCRVSEGAIRKQAKRYKWERDLTEQVTVKVRSELVRSEVRGTHETRKVSEREIVAEAAMRGADIILNQRRSCKNLNDMRDQYLQRLASFDPATADPRLLSQYADILESLTRTTERLQNAERRVFNLNQVLGPDTGDSSAAESDRRAAKLLVQLTADLKSAGADQAGRTPAMGSSGVSPDQSAAE